MKAKEPKAYALRSINLFEYWSPISYCGASNDLGYVKRQAGKLATLYGRRHCICVIDTAACEVIAVYQCSEDARKGE